MSANKNIRKITLNGTGTEIPSLGVNDSFEVYYLTGTATAIGNYALAPIGTPKLGTTFKFNYDGALDITTNSTTFTLFGTTLVQQQLIKPWTAEVFYNGTSWEVLLKMDFADSEIVITSNIQDSAITTSKINNLAVTTAKIDNLAVTTGKIADQNVTTVKIADSNITTVKLATDAVTTVKITDANVTNAKLANMAANTVKANNTGSSAAPQDVPISTLLNGNAWLLTGNSGTTPGTNFIGTTDAADLVFKANNIECGRVDVTTGNVTFGSYLASNTTGYTNIAIGGSTLFNNTSGFENIAIGASALLDNTTGSSNTAIGRQSLENVTTGADNTAIGRSSGTRVTSGSNNTFLGEQANVNIGGGTASNRIAIGVGAEADQDFQFALPDNVTELKAVGIASIKIDALPSYDDNAAALLGGLTAGELFAASGGGTIAQGIVCQVY